MKNILAFIILGFMFPVFSKAQETRSNLAIYVTGDINPGYKKVLGANIVSRITMSDKYSAVERTADFLSTLTREQDYQTSGVVSDTQIARLGEQFGVQYVIVADASEIFGSIFIAARMINVESAQIIASITYDSKVDSMETLVNLATEVSDALMGELLYPGLLSRVEIRGPFDSTEDLMNYENFRLYSPSKGEELIRDVKLIEYIAKACRKKGQSCSPVLTAVEHIDEPLGTRGAAYNHNYYATLIWPGSTNVESNKFLGAYLLNMENLKIEHRSVNSFYIYVMINE